MATAGSFLSEDQFLCSICLEVFTNPVSIPCGHNFCKACISRHWKDKEQCQCPLCKEDFSKGLKLCVNTTLREVVEKFKKNNVPKTETPVKPEDVLCDCCLHNKCKASKTCLVCLASYCETHLESHHRVPALKRHKLTDPVQNLEEKICRKHNMILESLCSNDPTPACALCIKHDTTPVKEEHRDQKPPMVNKKNEAQGRKGKQRKNAQRKMVKHEAPANSVELDSEECSDVFIWCNQYFVNFSKIPLNKGISKGRFYYEVQIEGQNNLDLGVVSESRRWRRIFGPDDMNHRWLIRLFNCSKCRARNPKARKIPLRVWVCVDYEQGAVLFCDANTRALFFILTECRFRQKVFLFFQSAPLMQCPPCIQQHVAKKPVETWLVILGVFCAIIFALSSLFK